MFHNLSIRNKLIAGFSAIVAIILFLLILAFHNFGRLSEANERNHHTLEVLLELDQIATSVLQVQSSSRGYLLTGNETLVAPIRDEFAQARAHVKRALELTVDNARQQDRLRRLDSLMQTWVDQSVTPQLDARRRAGATGPVNVSVQTETTVLAGSGSVATVRQVLNEAEAEENHLLGARQQNTDDLRQTMNRLLTAGGVTCVLLAVLISTLLVRAVSRPLDSLMQATGQIASGVHGARAQVLARDELGQVAMEFNRMAQSIEDSQAKEQAATNELRAKVDALLDVVSRAARGDLTGTITIRGDDAIGRMGEGLSTMLGNLRSLLNNVQRAGIQVTTSATQIAASAREQEATGIEQAQTTVEVLSTTREISANTSQLLRTMEEATEVADFTTSATAEAQDNLKRMDQSMQQMVTATDTI
ncbi:MAG: CHASE3 domain-containing protein, partial [Massilia sp.]|nr:CHASE3 domain-containing protein [Massilia sp.]